MATKEFFSRSFVFTKVMKNKGYIIILCMDGWMHNMHALKRDEEKKILNLCFYPKRKTFSFLNMYIFFTPT